MARTSFEVEGSNSSHTKWEELDSLVMSAVLILELSNASARSKGQALRRLQPALSEDARKARRKQVRQTRLEKKKQVVTEQAKELLPKRPSKPPYRRQSHPFSAGLGHSRPDWSQTPLQVEHLALASLNQGHDSSDTISSKQRCQDLTDRGQKQNDEDDSLLPREDDPQLYTDTPDEGREAIDPLERVSSHNINVWNDSHAHSEEDRALMVLLGLPPSPYVRGSSILPDTQLPLGFLSTTQSIDGDGEEFALRRHEDSRHWFQCCRNPLCQYAYKIFRSKSTRDQHLLDHHGTLMACNFCPYDETPSFPLKDFQAHLRTEHAVWEFANDVVDQETFSGSPSTCSTCHGLFRTAQGFSEHLEACIVHYLEQRSPQRWVDLMLKSGEDQPRDEELVFPVYGTKYPD